MSLIQRAPSLESFMSYTQDGEVLNPPEAIKMTKKQLKLGRVGVTSIHIEPEIKSDAPTVVIDKGYLTAPEAYFPYANALAARGRKVLLYGTNRKECLFKNPLTQQAKITWEVMKDAQAEDDIDEFDIYGHSMGFPIAARVAAVKGKYIRSLVGAGGAGSHVAEPRRLPHFRNMAGGLIKTAVVEAAPNGARLHRNMPSGFLAAEGAHVGRNFPLLALEGVFTAIDDARPFVETAREEHGVRVGGILFEQDTFFKPNDVLEHSGHLFDYFEVVKGALHIHTQLFHEEHADEYMRVSHALNYADTFPVAS